MIHISLSHEEGLFYYLISYLFAVLIGIIGAAVLARRRNFTYSEFGVVVSAGILFLLIGSKLILFDMTQWRLLFTEGSLPSEPGKSILGAILGGVLGVWAAGKYLGKSDSALDLFAISFPLGMAIQRIGCLFSGCCHGIITSLPWGITYGPGSRIIIDQQNMGLISEEAMTSLPVHPNQIYSIIACILIATIVWKTMTKWKSYLGLMTFSIILYLVFRFFEEFTRYETYPEVWMGLKVIQWKLMIISIVLLGILLYRERKHRENIPKSCETSLLFDTHQVKFLSSTLIVLLISLLLADWLTADERIIVALTIFPLSGTVLIYNTIHIISSQSYLKKISFFVLALIFMSQKVDDSSEIPKSFTSVNITSAFGKFDVVRNLNGHSEAIQGTDCDGNPTTNYQYSSDKVPYTHSYFVGGLGLSRKTFYNEKRNSTASLNLYIGNESQRPFDFYSESFQPPHFRNTLWGINPMFQYDGGLMGIGGGIALGHLGYDKKATELDIDYDPSSVERTYSFQGRLRFFDERIIFLETQGGFDAGSMGEYNWQTMVGSRFNSNKYLLKLGFVRRSGNRDNDAIFLQGQFPLSENIFFSPGFIYYQNDYHNNYQARDGYRAVLGIEYRLYDKK